MKKRNSADGADTFERDREKERCRAEIIESSNSRKREKREKRQKREREKERREKTRAVGDIVSEDITIRNMITRGTDAYLHLRPPRGGCRGTEEDNSGASRAR